MLVSIVVPVFNEEENIKTFYDAVTTVMDTVDYDYELIYFEVFQNINEAIYRENELKTLSRENKLALIKSVNPKLKKYAIL